VTGEGWQEAAKLRRMGEDEGRIELIRSRAKILIALSGRIIF